MPSTGVIIPSAGQGTRMGSERLPKQLQELHGTPVLAHTLSRILKLESVRFLVIPTSTEIYQKTLHIVTRCLEQSGKSGQVEVEVVIGGSERMHSVKNGLDWLSKMDVELVLVHDAVRPCFPLEAVEEAVCKAIKEGAAILAIPASDTVKMVDDHFCVERTPARNSAWLAQTPQVFRIEILKEAFEKADKAGFIGTDDASLVEFAGYPVYVVPGNRENIKITFPSDLYFAEKWVKKLGTK
ncbi:MAG: 2-C-methyl-D-erythritol 4-phosphate cytidylyltransferase [Balneolales bacterium]